VRSISGSRFKSYFEPCIFNDLAGKQIVVRLTLTDTVGNTSSDEVTINLVR
jgi:hypothetical protein